MKASGVDPALLEEIGAMLTWPASAEQIERAMHLVPDEVVQLITASGPRTSAAPRCASTSTAAAPARSSTRSETTCAAMIDAFADGAF